MAEIHTVAEDSSKSTMWTNNDGSIIAGSILRYGSDLTDAEWAIVAPLLTASVPFSLSVSLSACLVRRLARPGQPIESHPLLPLVFWGTRASAGWAAM
jgi:hypothetical protein